MALKGIQITSGTAHSYKPEINPETWKMCKYFNFYMEKVQPLVAEICIQPMDGIHGLNTHTLSVVFRGIDYSISMGQDPTPVIFACACHDMARENDEYDELHGKRAVPLAQKIMKQFPDLLDKPTRMQILSAILNHTKGTCAPDYISACLWDADRTRLSWQEGFDEKFFNTARGNYVASHYFGNYIKFQKRCFEHFDWSRKY